MTRLFYGWRVVAACFVIAAVAWSLGLFGSSVYLQAVTSAHGWPIAEVASAITLFFLVSAAIQRIVGRSIDRWGPRPVLLLGLASMATGVALIGQVAAISCGVYRNLPVLDLDYDEDSAAEADSNFVLTDDGSIVEIQATGEKRGFSQAEFEALFALARQGTADLFKMQRAAISG